jgi:hypothetical protein
VSEYSIRFIFQCVKQKIGNFSQLFRRTVGFLSEGAVLNPDNFWIWIGQYPNSYAIKIADSYYECWVAGETHLFELPEGAIEPTWKTGNKNVYGCGLVVDPEDKLAIFFTLNGKLMGELMVDVRGGIKKTNVYFKIINFTLVIIHNYRMA